MIATLLLAAGAAASPTVDVGPYLQDVREGGATIVWETAEELPDEAVVDLPAGPRRFPTAAGRHHEAHVTGLAPGRYRYHVGARGGEVATAPPPTSPFSFIVYGDNRDRDVEHAQVVAAMAREHADFLINTGDLVGDAGAEALWRRFFQIEGDLLASVPLYPALGNHEILHDPAAQHFHRYFALPSSGQPEPTERYYSFRFGNALFVALDGNESGSRAQAKWFVDLLDGAAKDPSIQHTFVFFHQPPFSDGDFCGSAAEQGLWVPEIERHGVRAVFTGHDHSYQRLERDGVRYFVAGGGGAPLHHESASCPAYDRHALRIYRAVHHYLRVRVSGAQATLEALLPDGTVIDTVALHDAAVAPAIPSPPIPYNVAPLRASLLPGVGDAMPGAMPGWLLPVGLLAVAAACGLALLRRRRP